METTYDYKLRKSVIVLSSKLEIGQALNIVAHLSYAAGRRTDESNMGRECIHDSDEIAHRGISKFPIIITKMKPAKLRRAIEAAREDPQIVIGDFPKQMLETGHDDELAAAIASSKEADLEYLGIIIEGPTQNIDAISGRFSLWN